MHTPKILFLNPVPQSCSSSRKHHNTSQNVIECFIDTRWTNLVTLEFASSIILRVQTPHWRSIPPSLGALRASPKFYKFIQNEKIFLCWESLRSVRIMSGSYREVTAKYGPMTPSHLSIAEHYLTVHCTLLIYICNYNPVATIIKADIYTKAHLILYEIAKCKQSI